MPFLRRKVRRTDARKNNCLRGIVNGIDYDEWNPATDPFIPNHYDAITFRKEKNEK